MGTFERFLSLWVALAAGVGLGLVLPELFQVVSRFEWARVNLVVAVLIWLMVYPMMLKVEPSCLKNPFNVAAPAAMIGTSNFFELAVAVAISLFGLASGAALATAPPSMMGSASSSESQPKGVARGVPGLAPRSRR